LPRESGIPVPSCGVRKIVRIGLRSEEGVVASHVYHGVGSLFWADTLALTFGMFETVRPIKEDREKILMVEES
jgi:hypothetical protein